MVQHVEGSGFGEDGIPRGDTAIRALKALLFVLIFHVVLSVLWALTVFSLVIAFATRTPPSARVRHFSNRVLAYGYRIGRYLTYNEDQAPFPFDDFPEEIEE